MKKDISKICLNLARKSVEYYLKNKMILPVPKNLPDFLIKNKKGVFISIFKKNKDELRGCIGTYKPTRKNIAEEIIHNSLSAAFGDPRFAPLTKNELNNLFLEVSVLEKPTQIKSFKELDPKIFGIIIISENGKQALLLPDIQGIKTREQQLMAICQKANIDPSKEKINLFKFKIEKFSEK